MLAVRAVALAVLRASTTSGDGCSNDHDDDGR